MHLPPDLTRGTADITTSAVANTGTTGTIVTTPGAGRRIRLWSFWGGPTNTAQAAANWVLASTSGVGGNNLLRANGATFAAPPALWIGGGVVLAANTALGWSVQSAMASLTMRAIVYYTLEDV